MAVSLALSDAVVSNVEDEGIDRAAERARTEAEAAESEASDAVPGAKLIASALAVNLVEELNDVAGDPDSPAGRAAADELREALRTLDEAYLAASGPLAYLSADGAVVAVLRLDDAGLQLDRELRARRIGLPSGGAHGDLDPIALHPPILGRHRSRYPAARGPRRPRPRRGDLAAPDRDRHGAGHGRPGHPRTAQHRPRRQARRAGGPRRLTVQSVLGRVGLPAPLADLVARRWDVVVIGGGHNGLVAAFYLARAGLSVVVLERRAVLGGCAVTEEVDGKKQPGCRVSTASYMASMLRPEIIRDLALGAQGLRMVAAEPTVQAVTPDGEVLP